MSASGSPSSCPALRVILAMSYSRKVEIPIFVPALEYEKLNFLKLMFSFS